MEVHVVKLGGSLLDFPELRHRLANFVGQTAPQQPVLVFVGGGELVEAIRSYDRLWSLDTHACHWMCVQLLNSTASLLHLLFNDWQLLTSARELEHWQESLSEQRFATDRPQGKSDFQSTEQNSSQRILRSTPRAIVAPSAFYTPKLNADALPISWDTTSDSISCLLARLVGASELSILKSTGLDSTTSSWLIAGEPNGNRLKQVLSPKKADSQLQFLQQKGLVDKSFDRVLPSNLVVRCINLRTWGNATLESVT